jgi:hypothetical protein
VAILALALALTGCSTTNISKLVEAMAKDPATVCITVTSIYGTVKSYRTAAPNATVKCDQEGMSVRSSP